MKTVTFVSLIGLLLGVGACAVEQEVPEEDIDIAAQAASATAKQAFIRGDADASGVVDLSDIIRIAEVVDEGGQPSTGCGDRMDVNNDGLIDGDDVLDLQRYLFSGGDEPAAPFPSAGLEAAPYADPWLCGDDADHCNRHTDCIEGYYCTHVHITTAPGWGGGQCAASTFIRGDVNVDGQVDGSDYHALYDWYMGNLELVCEDAADANDDGIVNIFDFSALYSTLREVWGVGPAVTPAPFPEAGIDPTSDELRCGQ